MPSRLLLGLSVGSLGALGLLCTSEAQAQTLNGPQVARAVDQSLDIMKDHVTFLTLQDRYDAALGYFAFTHKLAPLRISFNDGSSTTNMGHRVTFMEGAGIGKISEFAFFVGAWNDLVAIGPSSGNRLSFQGIAFAGIGLFGAQGTYSRFVGQRLDGLDMYGNFTTSLDTSSRYDGPGMADIGSKSSDVFTLDHESGASLIALRSELPTRQTVLSDVRAQFQPLKDWIQEWTRAQIGLPMIAVQKVRDNIRELSRPPATPSLPSDSEDAPVAPTRPEIPTYEFEFGGDDLLGIGLRIHSTTEVSPKLRFARAEAGFYHDIGEGAGAITVAARSFAFNRAGHLEASVDSFARIAILPVGKDSVGFPIHAAISYSFNSPDAGTFLPVPNAHVFGYQLIIGLPDIARPLVPIIRPKEPKHASEPKPAAPGAAL